MFDQHALELTGTSGQNYTLIVFPMMREHEERGAVYVVTICKPSADGGDTSYDNTPLYLGQTPMLRGHFETHPKLKCFNAYVEAYKVGVENLAVGSILEDDQARRDQIEKDLQGQFRWVCNEWTG